VLYAGKREGKDGLAASQGKESENDEMPKQEYKTTLTRRIK
jgi:hypothetical protein